MIRGRASPEVVAYNRILRDCIELEEENKLLHRAVLELSRALALKDKDDEEEIR